MRILTLTLLSCWATLALCAFEYDKADDSWAAWDDEDDWEAEADDKHWNRNTRPNIFFMLLDDWGWNDVGYHNENIFTPNIDSLGENGLKLEQNYVMAFCTPSRAALMTGMDPFHIGRQNFVFRSTSMSGLTLDRQIMPQYLKGLNYSTHIVGKWHLGHCNPAYLASNRGFDTQFGIQNSGGYNTAHLDYVPPHVYDFFEDDAVKKDFDTRVAFQMDLFKDRAISLIEDQGAREASGEDVDPMFMYLAFSSSHFPVEAPFEYEQMYADVDDSEKRRSFMAMTTHMDDVIGNITQSMKDNGLYDNSIIILMGDNGAYSDKWDWIPWYGGGSNYPLRGQKSTLYEGGTRVPALVHSPLLRRSRVGKSTNKMFHITDWLPTIIRAAGGDPNDYPELDDLDGKDQYDVLFGHQWWAERHAFVYNLRHVNIPLPDGSFLPFDMGAIRYGRWKLLNFNDVYPLQPLGTFQLYDLKSDPNETTDVFDDYPMVAQYMTQKWQEAVDSMIEEDMIGFLPPQLQRIVLDWDGNQRTDFCNLDGTISDAACPDIPDGIKFSTVDDISNIID